VGKANPERRLQRHRLFRESGRMLYLSSYSQHALTNQYHLLSLNVDCHTEEVAFIVPSIKNCLSWGGGETKSWSYINSAGFEHAFLILPIAERTAGICIILPLAALG
jgi:hypothetical protein